MNCTDPCRDKCVNSMICMKELKIPCMQVMLISGRLVLSADTIMKSTYLGSENKFRKPNARQRQETGVWKSICSRELGLNPMQMLEAVMITFVRVLKGFNYSTAGRCRRWKRGKQKSVAS